MEPVARRTRRRRYEAMLQQHRERKKAKPSSDWASEVIAVSPSKFHNLVSSESSSFSSSSSSSSDSESASSLRSVSSNRSKKEEHEEEDVTTYVPEKRFPHDEDSDTSDQAGSYHNEEEDDEESVKIYEPEMQVPEVLSLSSSESEEQDSDSSDQAGSDYNKEEDDDEEVVEIEVEYKDGALGPLGSIDNPIVLRADIDDDDEEQNDVSVSSGSMNDSEDESRGTPATSNFVVDDEEEVVVRKDKVEMEQTKRPLTATEIQKAPGNSIMEQDVDEQAVQSPHESKESSCSPEVDSGEEMDIKDPQQEEINDCYKEMNTCLENAGIWLGGEDNQCCVSSRSMNDSGDENRCTMKTNNIVVNDENDDDEKVMVRKDKVKMRQSRMPLTATEIHRDLFNSIMEQNFDEQTVKVPRESKESNCCSPETDSGEEMKIKDPQQEEIDDFYKEMNTYLENGVDFAAGILLADEDNANNQEKLCEKGKHELDLEEEIGLICKLCSYIEEEIKHVLPPFHENPFAVSGGKDDYYGYGYRDPKNPLYFEDPDIEAQHFKVGDEFDTAGTVWEMKQGLRDSLLPQQREAFEFIWRNVCGGTNLDELMKKKTSEGGGCLISHAPGTGKTRLAIAFLETYMKFCKNSRPVVLAPASIILSWKQEFLKWRVEVPFVNLNEDELSEKEISFARSYFGTSCMRDLDLKAKRLIKLHFWKKNESVLAVGYSLFPMLVDQDEMFSSILIETPGVLVLDEAHIPRNENSRIFKVLKKVQTKKRILLSGTFFQNNFRELCNILCLVRKAFKDEIDSFKKKSIDESDAGKIRDLRQKMKPFCHFSGNQVLRATLPGLVVNKVSLQPSEHQKMLLKYEEEERGGHFEANVNMILISSHPMLLKCKESKTDIIEELKSGTWEASDSNKIRFVIRLIQLSSALEERVLVFSEYKDPLAFIKAILQSHHFGWREGIEIHEMNGSQGMETRKRTMDLFNKSDGEAKVMLASTRACSEGIQLIGASRVVFLDVAWNPSRERQAYCRAFRMGQQKVVHVYRLLMTDNDNSRCSTQNLKNSLSNYMLDNSDNGPQSTLPDLKDIIIERLLEENIVQEYLRV